MVSLSVGVDEKLQSDLFLELLAYPQNLWAALAVIKMI